MCMYRNLNGFYYEKMFLDMLLEPKQTLENDMLFLMEVGSFQEN